MVSHEITAADLVQITGISRHKLRSLLKSLPEFSCREASERVAIEYSLQDVAVLSVCVELEERFGMRRDSIASLTGSIRKAFSGPKPLANGAYLIIVPQKGTVKYLSRCPGVEEGIVFPLDRLVQRIDAHLHAGQQRDLSLGPMIVSRHSIEKGMAQQGSGAGARYIRRAK